MTTLDSPCGAGTDANRSLLVSVDATPITGPAWRVHREGREVRCYIEAESDREIGDEAGGGSMVDVLRAHETA